MAIDVLVPQMGESVLEGTILEWKVKVGDKVKLNQPLVELMTDKVNIEIPAEGEGVITSLLAKEGDVVPVGTRIAIIDDGSGDAFKPEKPDAKPASAPSAAKSAPALQPASLPKSEVRATADIGKGIMSPKVRMLIRQYSLDPGTIAPTGKQGRVTVEDVMRTVEGRSSSAGFTTGPIPAPAMPQLSTITPTAAAGTAAPAVEIGPKYKVEIPVFEPLPANLRERREPVAGVRKIISDHMVKSAFTAPHVTTFEEVDLTELTLYRNSIKQQFRADYGANITYLPFICKAVTTALKEYPQINASMTESEIIYKNYYNIGIAVGREDGLIVPVLKDADKKSIIELAVEMADLSDRARSNKLVPDDVSGGTFSLTNAGMFGATGSTPIINQPQSAILGIHAIQKKPWVVDGEIVIRDICNFGMSFDHRLIDGHAAVQFLHRVHEYLAGPKKLLLFLR